MRALIGRTDGACRGNPGPASIGVALYDASRDGADHHSAQPDATISAAIGTTTNNVAEWKAVISAIELAAELGASELQLFLDSKLVVEQLNGRWRVRDAKLAPLCDEARARLTRFAVWSAAHVPREENHQADALEKVLIAHFEVVPRGWCVAQMTLRVREGRRCPTALRATTVDQVVLPPR